MKAASLCAIAALGVVVVALVALSQPGAAPSNGTAAPVETAEPAPPLHRWNYKDGLEYGYEGQLSEDAKKAGQAVSNVMMYRYLGEKNGVYTIQSKTRGITSTVSCANPCELIKARTSIAGLGGSTERIPFSLDTIVGAALTDAMHGQLEVYRAAAHTAAAADADAE